MDAGAALEVSMFILGDSKNVCCHLSSEQVASLLLLADQPQGLSVAEWGSPSHVKSACGG